ncbi:hypothetical protein NKG94_29650 [Micromonospora sp. M12]
MPDGQREELARRSPNPGDVQRHFASRDLVVYPHPGVVTRCWSPTGGTGFCTACPTVGGSAKGSCSRSGKSARRGANRPGWAAADPATARWTCCSPSRWR